MTLFRLLNLRAQASVCEGETDNNQNSPESLVRFARLSSVRCPGVAIVGRVVGSFIFILQMRRLIVRVCACSYRYEHVCAQHVVTLQHGELVLVIGLLRGLASGRGISTTLLQFLVNE